MDRSVSAPVRLAEALIRIFGATKPAQVAFLAAAACEAYERGSREMPPSSGDEAPLPPVPARNLYALGRIRTRGGACPPADKAPRRKPPNGHRA